MQVSPQQIGIWDGHGNQIAPIDGYAGPPLRGVLRGTFLQPLSETGFPQCERLQRRCLPRIVGTHENHGLAQFDLNVFQAFEVFDPQVRKHCDDGNSLQARSAALDRRSGAVRTVQQLLRTVADRRSHLQQQPGASAAAPAAAARQSGQTRTPLPRRAWNGGQRVYLGRGTEHSHAWNYCSQYHAGRPRRFKWHDPEGALAEPDARTRQQARGREGSPAVRTCSHLRVSGPGARAWCKQ